MIWVRGFGLREALLDAELRDFAEFLQALGVEVGFKIGFEHECSFADELCSE